MTDPDPITRLNAALEGRYRIERELGEGGMATVYLADDLKHERKVALKVLKPELAAVVGAERFLAEIKTTANLTHPHILPLHDSGEADGFLYYVMPFVEGETLRDRIDREKQLPLDEAVRIVSGRQRPPDRSRAGYYPPRHQTRQHPIEPRRAADRRLRHRTRCRCSRRQSAYGDGPERGYSVSWFAPNRQAGP